MDEFLAWTACMEAKPSKCRSLALTTFTPGCVHRFTPHRGLKYDTYDPKLKIAGAPIDFIEDKPFKHLGRKVFGVLNESQQQTDTKESLETMLEAVDELQLRGLHTIWVYNVAVACRLSWPLRVYDFPHTFVEDLQRIANAYVKKWVGMARFGTNPIILYMPKKDKGLGVINLEHFYENLGIVREHLLKYSGDPVIVRLAARRLARAKADRHRKWHAPMALVVAERGLALDAMTAAGQTTRAGIGSDCSDVGRCQLRARRRTGSE